MDGFEAFKGSQDPSRALCQEKELTNKADPSGLRLPSRWLERAPGYWNADTPSTSGDLHRAF